MGAGWIGEKVGLRRAPHRTPDRELRQLRSCPDRPPVCGPIGSTQRTTGRAAHRRRPVCRYFRIHGADREAGPPRREWSRGAHPVPQRLSDSSSICCSAPQTPRWREWRKRSALAGQLSHPAQRADGPAEFRDDPPVSRRGCRRSGKSGEVKAAKAGGARNSGDSMPSSVSRSHRRTKPPRNTASAKRSISPAGNRRDRSNCGRQPACTGSGRNKESRRTPGAA